MTGDTEIDGSSRILRAFSLIQKSQRMAFIGIYCTDTYKPLAVADREYVQINPTSIDGEDQPRKISLEIQPNQVRAIVQHIVTKDNPLTQINIANLHFVCLRLENGCMSGMSNFNMDVKRESVQEIEESLSKIVHKHFTSEEILGGVHALQLSAILKENYVIIGVCRAGSESSLRVIREIFEEPEEIEPEHEETLQQEKNELPGHDKMFSIDSESSGEFEATVGSVFSFDRLQDPYESPEVELRRPGLSAEERKSIREKRETSFCEDWRAATVKSIEALRLIGPFRPEDDSLDRDDRPLIDNAESIDSRPQSTTELTHDEHGNRTSKDGSVIRRHSRATLV